MNSYFAPYYNPYLGLINGPYSGYLPSYPCAYGASPLVSYNPYFARVGSYINPYIGSYFGYGPYISPYT